MDVVAVVLDADGEIFELCRCADDDVVEERSRSLLETYAGIAAAVLFASVRAGPSTAAPGERARFRRLREHGTAVGVPVLDWLVVGDGAPYSLARDDVVR
jgi:hypothetical protein